MKTFDNSGKLVSEINHFRTADGKSVTTNTIFNTHNSQSANQNIRNQWQATAVNPSPWTSPRQTATLPSRRLVPRPTGCNAPSVLA
jgi:hypothetical protein